MLKGNFGSEIEIVSFVRFYSYCPGSFIIWEWVSSYTFDRVFQYKIVTNILPTNEYLARYRIKDTDLCDHCRKESDTIIHRLYECELIFSIVDKILRYITAKCNKSYTVSMIEYIFGKTGFEFLGLNHLLLELKKQFLFKDRTS